MNNEDGRLRDPGGAASGRALAFRVDDGGPRGGGHRPGGDRGGVPGPREVREALEVLDVALRDCAESLPEASAGQEPPRDAGGPGGAGGAGREEPRGAIERDPPRDGGAAGGVGGAAADVDARGVPAEVRRRDGLSGDLVDYGGLRGDGAGARLPGAGAPARGAGRGRGFRLAREGQGVGREP